MERVYNFAPGPSALPLSVLERAQQEMTCCGSSGMSVMEMSHRSPAYQRIYDDAVARLQVIHANAPGMVSRISAIISGEGINIENMTNKGRGDWAVTVLETDQPLPESAMEALRALPQAVRVRAVL